MTQDLFRLVSKIPTHLEQFYHQDSTQTVCFAKYQHQVVILKALNQWLWAHLQLAKSAVKVNRFHQD